MTKSKIAKPLPDVTERDPCANGGDFVQLSAARAEIPTPGRTIPTDGDSAPPMAR
jgi:hypothetical protein